MKKLIIIIVSAVITIFFLNFASMLKIEHKTDLFYMYSDDAGHYFLNPVAENENVIFVGLHNGSIDSNFKINTANLYHGKKFVGYFMDYSFWELEKIEEF